MFVVQFGSIKCIVKVELLPDLMAEADRGIWTAYLQLVIVQTITISLV